MGCKNSSRNEEELFNEDVDIKRRFLTGVHISKGVEAIEGNIQIALGTTRKTKYERVVNPTNPSSIENNSEALQEPPTTLLTSRSKQNVSKL